MSSSFQTAVGVGFALPGAQGPNTNTVINATKPATVKVNALSGGYFTIPEEQFVNPCVHGSRATVPSLCFLVQHVCASTGATTRIVFDLGLRRDLSRYSEPIRRHTETRQPITTTPDVVQSLHKAGLTTDDINYVIYSHVHWDHVGAPGEFAQSKFIVGNGSLALLRGDSTAPSLRGGHSFFEEDLLDPSRTIELSHPGNPGNPGDPDDAVLAGPPTTSDSISTSISNSIPTTTANFARPWQPLADHLLPAAMDIFQDGSLYVVDAPGHLPGHINLLARTGDDINDGHSKWVYLAGDACHDRRILRNEREIGEWQDVHGDTCCIHADRAQAEATLERIRMLESQGVEIILAHDAEWASKPDNRTRFFGSL